MNTSLARVRTSDGIDLHGLHFNNNSGNAKAILHLHGIWGNFYSNPFVDHFGEVYPQIGYDFVSANTRDHDDGALSADFDRCILDINTWLMYLAEKGYKNIILQGHSLGAIKAVFYLDRYGEHATRPHIMGLILLSPFDNIPFYSGGSQEKHQENLNLVRKVMLQDPNAIVPSSVWDMWALSAHTYLQLIEENGSVDVFPFRRGNLDNSPVSRISTKIFAAVGGKDFASYPSPEKEVEMLAALPNIYSVLIENAPHNFSGCESNLLSEITSWVKQIE